MKHHHQQEEEHDDTILPLISNATVIIEYLVPTMSQGLLSMFPDNSSSFLDFDHSQSSIWSPLVPRHYLSSLDPYGGNSRGRDGKRKKIRGCGRFDLTSGSAKRRKTNKRKSISSEDAAAESKDGGCGCIPFPGKGWNKMMKAASRQFKKRKMMRKNSTVIRVNLSNSKLDLLMT